MNTLCPLDKFLILQPSPLHSFDQILLCIIKCKVIVTTEVCKQDYHAESFLLPGLHLLFPCLACYSSGSSLKHSKVAQIGAEFDSNPRTYLENVSILLHIPRSSLVPAVHLADPFAVIYLVAIGFRMPSHRFRMPCDSLMMVVHLTRILIYWSSNGCLVVICDMLLTRHTCMKRSILPFVSAKSKKELQWSDTSNVLFQAFFTESFG